MRISIDLVSTVTFCLTFVGQVSNENACNANIKVRILNSHRDTILIHSPQAKITPTKIKNTEKHIFGSYTTNLICI